MLQTGVMVDPLADIVAATVRALEAGAVPDEALASLKRPRWGQPRLVETGRAWRLGVLLIDRPGRLFEVGELTRAVEPQRGFANKSPEAEARRELRRAAVRGKFATGEAVNFGCVPVELGRGILSIVDGVPMVRWNASGDLRPLEGYLAERVALHLEA